ncbi:hypothetical protein D9M68_17840 [compost metagenome]
MMMNKFIKYLMIIENAGFRNVEGTYPQARVFNRVYSFEICYKRFGRPIIMVGHFQQSLRIDSSNPTIDPKAKVTISRIAVSGPTGMLIKNPAAKQDQLLIDYFASKSTDFEQLEKAVGKQNVHITHLPHDHADEPHVSAISKPNNYYSLMVGKVHKDLLDLMCFFRVFETEFSFSNGKINDGIYAVIPSFSNKRQVDFICKLKRIARKMNLKVSANSRSEALYTLTVKDQVHQFRFPSFV